MNINHQHNILFSTIFILFALLTIIPFPWNDTVNDSLIDLQFILRGERQISEDFVVVFIGDEELKSLGQFPISRDYYSYVIHILKSKGAKVIGLDVLLAQKDKYHPEFDQTLVEFAKNSGNVCLPMAFSELKITDSLYNGINPIYPFEELRNSAAGLGFSNFSKLNNLRKVPLVAEFENEIIPSFGYQLASLFSNGEFAVDVNENFGLRLNHFGSIEYINSIGFVDLLRRYKDNPDSLNFDGKLVLITVTASGVANLKSTPYDNAFPSSLAHLTVAENLIHKNYLVDTTLYLNLIILVLLFAGFWLIVFKFKSRSILYSILFIFAYWIVAMLLFSFYNLVVPIFYPSLAIISLLLMNQITSTKDKQQMDSVLQDMLQTQLDNKELQLRDAKEKFNDLVDQLKNEFESKEELQHQATINKDQVLQLEKEINDLKSYDAEKKLDTKTTEFENIIYSPKSKMAEVLDLVSKVATSDIPVLILGDTGTGKEMIAKAIHQKSNRKYAPFIALNCGALPETLLESELFGHEKGSFTGAVSMRKGKFELADGGTIFLDEISETSPIFQAKLLRVLQESTFERVGGEKSLQVNIRVIAATNRDLQKEIEEGRFRSDLFFRLNGFPISIPALNERIEDIPVLINHFLKKHDFEISFSDSAMQYLKNNSWPGNVRELENVVRRSAIMVSTAIRKLIQIDDLPDEIRNNQSNIENIHRPLEEQILESLRSLKFSRSSIMQTAKILGNKDRGTITEYFRGICFQKLSESHFDILSTSQIIAGTNEEEVVKQVEIKINEYLKKLKSSVSDSDSIDFDTIAKGLPKKYHESLKAVISYLISTI